MVLISYQLHGHTLEKADSAKYLGITIQNNLSGTNINKLLKTCLPDILKQLSYTSKVYSRTHFIT
jgi:hypothetical protein